jgi:hypothetical protein
MAGPAFRSMAISGDVLRFIDGSEFRIKKSAAETSGEYLEMEWFLPPSTETPPKHVHPQQRENYEVLDYRFQRKRRHRPPRSQGSSLGRTHKHHARGLGPRSP